MKTLKLFHFWTIVLVLLLVSCSKDEENSPNPQDQVIGTQVSSVFDPSGQVVGQAKLVRYPNRIAAEYESNALINDHAYTLWWVIWNKPENCNGSPCEDPDFANPVEVDVLYGTGKVVNSGRGKFSATLKVGNDEGSINDLFELPPVGGLLDVEKAEVHLVLRSHGPKISGQEQAQIQTYGGGCSKEIPPFTEIPQEEGECSDIEFAVFLPLK